MLQKVTVKKLILIIVCVCTGCISGSASNVCAFMRHLSLPLDVCQEDSLPVDSLAPDNQEENYVFTDSLAPDNPGFGGVFNAFDKILTKAPVIEQLLTDSLVGEGKDFSDLSKRKQKRLIGKFLGDQFTEWNNIDTTYITPQLYDFALMLQTTTSFENFTLNSEGENKQTLKFAPNPSFRLGGYFGWRWIFWGYNIDMNGLFGNKQHNTKKVAFDFSFYTSKVGVRRATEARRNQRRLQRTQPPDARIQRLLHFQPPPVLLPSGFLPKHHATQVCRHVQARVLLHPSQGVTRR